ncbi:MAG: D-aminoacyl-tRNA deacylase [Cocleimonas sp.]
MIALIQRVTQASVTVNHENIAEIKIGILVLLGVEKHDTQKTADELLHKVINYRIFEDQNQKMNLSLIDTKGHLLIVPQFTLPANTKKGLRPSFASAAPPEQGDELYKHFVYLAEQKVTHVQTGRFGADMQVNLTNNGPVTFWLQK